MDHVVENDDGQAIRERVVAASLGLRPFFPKHSPFTDWNGLAFISEEAVAALNEWRAAVDALREKYPP